MPIGAAPSSQGADSLIQNNFVLDGTDSQPSLISVSPCRSRRNARVEVTSVSGSLYVEISEKRLLVKVFGVSFSFRLEQRREESPLRMKMGIARKISRVGSRIFLSLCFSLGALTPLCLWLVAIFSTAGTFLHGYGRYHNPLKSICAHF